MEVFSLHKNINIMYRVTINIFFYLIAGLILTNQSSAQIHPNLLLTKKDIESIKLEWNKYSIFRKTFSDAKNRVDKAIQNPIDVPVPKDAGGYTHERHKQNYTEMYLAGILFQVTNEIKYADFVKQMLFKYADLYPTLDKHPAAVSNSPGRLFWQSLNECVWAVHATQAYDCIYDFLTPHERIRIEQNVFQKLGDFLSVDRVEELDLIHNHGTWSCAAVGMIGFVLRDKGLVDKSLYGSKKNKEGGFLKQMETLFSPDGYYTEGAYYIRYAMMPFFLFSQVIENNRPELKIFEYRDQILKKAFYAAIQLTYTNGEFIPFNDALKEKNYLSPEIVIGLNISYERYGEDKTLLGIAKKQNVVMLTGAGLRVAKAIEKEHSLPNFNYKSVEYSDGANGDEGGIGVMRFGPLKDQSLLLMKYTAHGLSHGHYDKLAFLYYDQGTEIIQDYGAARFINVEPKYGGRYLPETKLFCMQSIAHNTVVVDEKSHFNGNQSISEKYHSEKHFYSCVDSNFQIVSAKDFNAYKDIKMQRTMAMINDDRFMKPIVVDLFKVDSDNEHQYDLPFYYMGHFIYSNTEYTSYDNTRTIMGSKNGYQYLWKEAETTGNGLFKFSWMNGNRFYSITSCADTSTKIYFARIGASDPNYNLRNEPSIIFRKKAKSHLFASILEPHGNWDGVREFSTGAKGVIDEIKIIGTNEEATIVKILGKQNLNWILMITNQQSDPDKKHSVEFNAQKFEWTGDYYLLKN
jgi:hypothetical protein